MRGDKGGARLTGGRSGGRGRDRGAGELGAPGARAGGRREPAVRERRPFILAGWATAGFGVKALRGEGKEGLETVGGNGSVNETRRIKGRKG